MDAFWNGFDKEAALKPTTQLQEHQVRVNKRLDKTPGILLYHGLGSGKTLSSLSATQGHKPDVVVPASLRTNYQKEVDKHTTGFKPNIMSYEKSVKTPQQGDALVLDEAHQIGRIDSERSRKMIQKAKGYDKRILLTGTPIRNHPREIGPLMRVVRGDDKIPSDPKAFDSRFIKEVTIKPGIWDRVVHGVKPGVEQRIKNPHQFSQLVAGYVDHYAPPQKDFPAVTHETIPVPMSNKQHDYYKFVMDKAPPSLRRKIEKGLPPSKAEAEQLNSFLSGARQVSNSIKSYGAEEITPKIQTAVTALDELHKKDRNFRGLVYSNYLDSGVKGYADELKAKGISHAIYDGSLSDKKRKQVVDDYNAGRTKVLLISGAGSQGLDLKGTKLIQVLDPHWNSARTDQVQGRGIRYQSHSHLPESERHVLVQNYHSVIPKSFSQKIFRQKPAMSVDQYLTEMNKSKDKLNEQFLSILREQGSKPV